MTKCILKSINDPFGEDGEFSQSSYEDFGTRMLDVQLNKILKFLTLSQAAERWIIQTDHVLM